MTGIFPFTTNCNNEKDLFNKIKNSQIIFSSDLMKQDVELLKKILIKDPRKRDSMGIIVNNLKRLI